MLVTVAVSEVVVMTMAAVVPWIFIERCAELMMKLRVWKIGITWAVAVIISIRSSAVKVFVDNVSATVGVMVVTIPIVSWVMGARGG